MKWPNVKLIFFRELRDQMRDRRTLFTVAIMPMVLYPLMGMAMLQVAQFMREYPTKVWVVGHENLPESPPFIIEGELNGDFITPQDARLLQICMSREGDQEFHKLIRQFREQSEMTHAPQLVDQLIQSEMRSRGVDVAVFIPKPIELATEPFDETHPDQQRGSPSIYLFQNTAVDQSRIGAQRIRTALGHWQKALIKETLRENNVRASLIDGVRISEADVADKAGKKAAAWSKIFPFIVMIWSLTGAFYPAIDLCAGEKERGTFETLLSSPAARSEIAIGKLLTVMSFSMATSILNLLSMGFTGLFVVSRMGGTAMGGGLPMVAPPIASIGWLLLALIPISALFSAVALAAAAFARSSKEGQYYLVPLMMISMPLMMVPMLPAAKLDFGSSLIPVSGLMLLLRGLIEGQYSECLKFAGPVCAVTLACCWFAIRWVVYQFNSESVLFRPSERFGVGTWFRYVMRERDQLPSFGSVILLAIVILVGKFFIGFVIQTPLNFGDFAKQTVIILVATIAVPTIMMALVLTRNARKSLKLHRCTLPMACAAVLAAILLNPAFTWFTSLVMYIYPPADDLFLLNETVGNIVSTSPGIWATIAVFALVPAIIEELAFRGFILSGFESMRNRWQAIVLASIFFGITHGVLQQSVITFGVGLVLGLIAIQTRSILPCILFHLTHNSLAVLLSAAEPTVIENSLILKTVLMTTDGVHYQYGMLPGIAMTVLGISLLVWFIRLDGKERPLLGTGVESWIAGFRKSTQPSV
ncbi:MAG: ABC transporter permease subunit/CPBP intramembrane protease [Planctomycetota bacterium]